MKVIFVVPNLSSGGAERVVSILSNSFVECGIKVDVLLLKDCTVSYSINEEVNIVHLDADLLTCSKIESFKLMRSYFKKEKRQNDKLVVIPFLDVCLKRALVAAWGLNIPIIASERNDPNQKGVSFVKKIKANIPYLLSQHCVFQTRGAQDYYCKSVRKKSSIIMNPLVMPRDVRWKGADSKCLVSVGRLEQQKNQHLLIDAFSKIHCDYPDYTLEIYGEGSLRDILQKRINELGLGESVCLCGNSSNIYGVLENAFLFVLPSNYEGMSNALIEALSIGMPVITTDHPCGGAKMLVQHGENGLLIPVNDEDAMVCAIKSILEDRKLALHISENSRRLKDVLSVEKISKMWMDILVRL